ncbi:anti-sigma factor [Streptomyces sp. TLI_105]|uniref:anti-sigma factor n=1 Tax=Streptomyces sp. TLI_105 TaxID=1881019 RepID=UPI0008960764|nr:anti-sigma factor [Streptomyces sp. TLI_105]SEB85229.1 Anti-sigma-K factor RskA [Streptomyces sp. TLI_105]
MKHDATDAHTLAAAHALGALDDDERTYFEDHLRTCEACRQEATEFEATTARLAAAVSYTPPAAAKAQVMAAIDGVRQLPPRVPAPSTAPVLRGFLRRRAASLALAACVAAAALGGVAVWRTQDGQDLERQARQAQQRLDEVSAVLAAPDARTIHGKAANGALTTVVASDRQNKAVFTAANLPAPGTGKTYQLWLDHDGTMRPAGLIDHDGTVILTGNPADAAGVGLTLEPTGGSPQPTTDPLLLMALPA